MIKSETVSIGQENAIASKFEIFLILGLLTTCRVCFLIKRKTLQEKPSQMMQKTMRLLHFCLLKITKVVLQSLLYVHF